MAFRRVNITCVRNEPIQDKYKNNFPVEAEKMASSEYVD
jgi:hypothetical protein